MVIEFDTQKINTALSDFYNATGIDIDLFGQDLTPAVSRRVPRNSYCRAVQSDSGGIDACRASDRELVGRCKRSGQLEMHVCHAGMVDAAAPIEYGGQIIGYIIFGCMKPKDGVPQKHRAEYDAVPPFDAGRIRSVTNIVTMFVKYILLENLLLREGGISAVAEYIDRHLHTPLSVRDISKSCGISKSALYSGFHAQFGCTVSGYINKRRTERAKELLDTTDMSVEEISQRVGYSSASYFSKIFKRITGVSPLTYRKTKKDSNR